MDWNAIIVGLVSTVVVPFAVQAFNAWLKTQRLSQWQAGAAAAAGRVALAIADTYAKNPHADFGTVVEAEVRKEAERFLGEYAGVAAKLDAGLDQAVSRITGELGARKLLEPIVSMLNVRGAGQG